MTLSVILLILAGCGDQETGPGDSGGPLNGSWQFERHLSMMDFTCHTTGTVTLKQVGDDFTGEVKNSREDCSGDFSPSGSDDDDGPLMNGVIAKATVTSSSLTESAHTWALLLMRRSTQWMGK
jgi:hypothetical protein